MLRAAPPAGPAALRLARRGSPRRAAARAELAPDALARPNPLLASPLSLLSAATGEPVPVAGLATGRALFVLLRHLG